MRDTRIYTNHSEFPRMGDAWANVSRGKPGAAGKAGDKDGPGFEKMGEFGEKVLARAKRKFGQAEVFVEGGTGVTVWFKDGRLDNIEKKSEKVLGLRVINKGRIGLSGCLSEVDIDRLLREAEFSASFGAEAKFEFPSKIKAGSSLKTLSPDVLGASVEAVVDDGQKAVKRLGSDLKGFLLKNLVAAWNWSSTRLMNTNGVDLTKRGTRTEIFPEVIREKEGDFFDVGVDSLGRRWERPMSDIVSEIEERVVWGKKIMSLKDGKYVVIFPPEMVETLLEYVGEAVDGGNVNDKASKLVGKIGEKVFDDRVTIMNDALVDWRVGSELFDDEGVQTGSFALVDKGILKNFVYDLQEAGKAGAKPNGSGMRASVFFGTFPGVHNLMIGGGAKPWKQILKGIKRGLMPLGFVGQGQGNMLNGDFQLGLQLGYLIHDGEIVGRVKGLGLAGNVFDLLKGGLVEMSRDTEWHGAICAPYVVLGGIKITKTG